MLKVLSTPNKWILGMIILCFVCQFSEAQRLITPNSQNGGMNMGNGMENEESHFHRTEKDGDKKKKEEETPIGLRTWTANRWNETDSVVPDTMPHHFHKMYFTEGPTGRYSTLGNMGSPRLSRIFADRPNFSYFIFNQPYDFFLKPFETFHFTNTLSPITNITYNETTDSDDGEDRITAKYAINIDKNSGIGFNLDYLYGRGYYQNQSTSQFGATIFGSVRKEHYQGHYMLFSNHLKTTENGGITDDDYVSNPEKFPSNFTTKDIPTNLNKAWNKMYVNGAQVTHSYSIGFYKYPKITASDSMQRPLGVAVPSALKADSTKQSALATLHNDSTRQDTLSFAQQKYPTDSMPLTAEDSLKRIFVPVSKLIHTLRVESNERKFTLKGGATQFFTNDFMNSDSIFDKITHLNVSNTFALELCEGFNKWAVAGIRLFAQHEYNHYAIPMSPIAFQKFNENRITLGGMLLRRQGAILHYDALAQTSSDGDSWGEFELKGHGQVNLPLRKDTISLNVYASVINQRPTFFYRHYQSHSLWWDNDNLDNQFTTRIGGTLSIPRTKTRLFVDVQNLKKYTYFASNYQNKIQGQKTYMTIDTEVKQASDNIQVLALGLNQDFRLGILNWENEITYQTTSNKDVLPLPELNLYSNLYLLFRVAKVLRIEFGGDVRYFTKYTAPTYNPALGMYTNQPDDQKISVGNHPIVDVYANCHLKHTRFYIMYSHVNYSSDGGNGFQVPHYPVNPGMLRLGLSWNFFN